MVTLLEAPVQQEIVYPESDGKPMADNTRQFMWIVTIKENCDVLFRDDPDVFVAGDLLWYPVQGKPGICAAPDVMIAFGRPKGHRGSYQQWREGNIAPQVVFEILSPGNTVFEMSRKFDFFGRHGVEEYYLYDPDTGQLLGWQRSDGALRPVEQMDGWVSPRLGVRFELQNGELVLYYPDGRVFLTFAELQRQAEHAQQQAEHAQQQAAEERRRADAAQTQADVERERAERLLAQLRTLGIEPEA